MSTKPLKSAFERIPPAGYFFVCLISGWGLGFAWPVSLGLKTVFARLTFGGPLCIAAISIGAWTIHHFRRRRTPLEPFSTPTELLTSGPFRFSRNPLYVALALTLIALGVFLDSAWVLASVLVLILALNHFIIPIEEARLRKIFGGQYTAYSDRVRRWI